MLSYYFLEKLLSNYLASLNMGTLLVLNYFSIIFYIDYIVDQKVKNITFKFIFKKKVILILWMKT